MFDDMYNQFEDEFNEEIQIIEQSEEITGTNDTNLTIDSENLWGSDDNYSHE